jgi:hypothetical protein
VHRFFSECPSRLFLSPCPKRFELLTRHFAQQGLAEKRVLSCFVVENRLLLFLARITDGRNSINATSLKRGNAVERLTGLRLLPIRDVSDVARGWPSSEAGGPTFVVNP